MSSNRIIIQEGASQGSKSEKQQRIRLTPLNLAGPVGDAGSDVVASLSSCPFSKHFPKYRIDFTRVNAPNDEGFSLRIPFVSNVQKSIHKSQCQKKFPPEILIQWMEDENNTNFGEEEGVQAITVFERLWRAASDLLSSSSSAEAGVSDRVVLGLCDRSHLAVVQHWVDIFQWMQNEDFLQPLMGDAKMNATIREEGGMLLVELTHQGNRSSSSSTSSIAPISSQPYDPALLTKRTQAWVKRILVDQGICPFTKSVKVSGQGLGDLGIPVARIHYCSSDAKQHQLCKLMAGTFWLDYRSNFHYDYCAQLLCPHMFFVQYNSDQCSLLVSHNKDSWREISFMLEMGPSGRDGISSILLAAPDFDSDFDLWAGPVFAMLESGVVACGLEKKVGVVCFHPQYATPDGRSFPGFGHMHSVPRLKKWLLENIIPGKSDSDLEETTAGLTDDEIAAGGAWQRRTPHATINVLRADQLEAAEGRRVTSELYSENIQKLVGKPDGIGLSKLHEDLEKERALQ